MRIGFAVRLGLALLGLSSLLFVAGCPTNDPPPKGGATSSGDHPSPEPPKPPSPVSLPKPLGFSGWWAQKGAALVASCNYLSTREANVAAGFRPRSKVGLNPINEKILEAYYPTESCKTLISEMFGSSGFLRFENSAEHWGAYYDWRKWKELNEPNQFPVEVSDRTREEFVTSMVASGTRAREHILYGLHILFFHPLVSPPQSKVPGSENIAVTFFDDPKDSPFSLGVGWSNGAQPVADKDAWAGPVDLEPTFKDPSSGSLRATDLVLTKNYVNLELVRSFYEKINAFIFEHTGGSGIQAYQVADVIGVYSTGRMPDRVKFETNELKLFQKFEKAAILRHELQHAIVPGNHQYKCGVEECDDAPQAAYPTEGQLLLAVDLGATLFRAPGSTKPLAARVSNVFSEACLYYRDRYYTLHEDKLKWDCGKTAYTHYSLQQLRKVSSQPELPDDEKATYDPLLDF